MTITLEIILGTVCTLAVFSYLHRENPVYRLFENIFIGIAVGHILVMSVGTIRGSTIAPILRGDLLSVLPLILGLCLYFYFSRKYFHVYRIPMAIIVGVGVGLGVRGVVHGTIVNLLRANVAQVDLGKDIMSITNNLIIVGGSLFVLFFFVFTFFIERAGITGTFIKGARYILMITFGAMLASQVLTLSNYLGERLIFLVQSDAVYLLPIGAAIFAAGILYDRYVSKQAQQKR